jgi:multidrug transporter EmrE-like cation transporter
MDLLKGFIYGLIAQVITFLQLQGQMKYDVLKNNTWFVVLLGLPISYLFMISVRHFVSAYDGQIWPSRLIGFGIGVVVFTLISHWLFKEPLTPKTLICLGLGSLIVLIQILWK